MESQPEPQPPIFLGRHHFQESPRRGVDRLPPAFQFTASAPALGGQSAFPQTLCPSPSAASLSSVFRLTFPPVNPHT